MVRDGRKRKGKSKDKDKGVQANTKQLPQSQSSSSGSCFNFNGSKSSPGPLASQNEEDRPKPPRVPISGARKIWGTLRSTTTVAVVKTLKSLTRIPSDSFKIKRKFKTAASNSKQVTRWWFVVRGEEKTLQQLQEAWSPVHLQTAWKLEPVFEFLTAGLESSLPTQQQRTSPAILNVLLGNDDSSQSKSTEPDFGSSSLPNNPQSQTQVPISNSPLVSTSPRD